MRKGKVAVRKPRQVQAVWQVKIQERANMPLEGGGGGNSLIAKGFLMPFEITPEKSRRGHPSSLTKKETPQA
ncbi:MAG: hypothetical protein LBQ75_01945 [Zoogloeaceae bacterium]|nr:hypothetical protein [Zoogloeaceae bacterium]